MLCTLFSSISFGASRSSLWAPMKFVPQSDLSLDMDGTGYHTWILHRISEPFYSLPSFLYRKQTKVVDCAVCEQLPIHHTPWIQICHSRCATNYPVDPTLSDFVVSYSATLMLGCLLAILQNKVSHIRLSWKNDWMVKKLQAYCFSLVCNQRIKYHLHSSKGQGDKDCLRLKSCCLALFLSTNSPCICSEDRALISSLKRLCLTLSNLFYRLVTCCTILH